MSHNHRLKRETTTKNQKNKKRKQLVLNSKFSDCHINRIKDSPSNHINLCCMKSSCNKKWGSWVSLCIAAEQKKIPISTHLQVNQFCAPALKTSKLFILHCNFNVLIKSQNINLKASFWPLIQSQDASFRTASLQYSPSLFRMFKSELQVLSVRSLGLILYDYFIWCYDITGQNVL